MGLKNLILLSMSLLIFFSCSRFDDETRKYIKYKGEAQPGNVSEMLARIDIGKVNGKITDITADQEASIDDLVSYIKSFCSNESEIAYAAYFWINTKISYDYGLTIHTSSETFASRKGICEGYSDLYAVLTERAGLKTVVVTGVTNVGADVVEGDPLTYGYHAWNAVRIDEKWYLLDATWHIFAPEPSDFIKTHKPEKDKWKLF